MAEALFHLIELLLFSAAQPPDETPKHNFHKTILGHTAENLGTVNSCGVRRAAIAAVSTAAEVSDNSTVS